jgi:hypothetical protein
VLPDIPSSRYRRRSRRASRVTELGYSSTREREREREIGGGLREVARDKGRAAAKGVAKRLRAGGGRAKIFTAGTKQRERERERERESEGGGAQHVGM